MIKFSPIAVYLTSWACVIATIWFLFEKTEDTVNTVTKASISAWLKNMNAGKDILNWPQQFSIIFDHIFGKNFLSRRFFFCSCIASTAASLIFFSIWAGSHLNFLQYCLQNSILLNASTAAFLTVILNYIPDYVSLMESRWIIQKMARSSALWYLPLLFLDVILTAGIWILWLFMMLVLFEVYRPDGSLISPTYTQMVDIINNAIFFTAKRSNEMSTFGIYFYSTFFTSIWVWMYAASGLTVKLVVLIMNNVNRLLCFLDIENRPIKSMGMIAMLMVTIAYLAVLLLNFTARIF